MADTKLSALVATTSVAGTDLLYIAKSPFGSSDSKKITVANLKTSLFNSPYFVTGDAGTYDNYLFVNTSPAVLNRGGIIVSNVYATTAGYNGFKMTSTFNSISTSAVFSMGFVELNATETFTTNANGFLNFYNNSVSGYIYARVPFSSSSSISCIYHTVQNGSSTYASDYSGGLSYAGNLVTTPYTNNGYASLATFATTDDNATKPKAGIIVGMTGAGTYMYFGTSSDYATGVTTYGFNLNPNGKVTFRNADTGTASINIGSSSGVTPLSPVNGDIWFTGTSLHILVGGTTKTFTLV